MTQTHRVFAAAFMDLSGAYDSVDRELLFRKLGSGWPHTRWPCYTAWQCIMTIHRQERRRLQPALHRRVRAAAGMPAHTTLFNLFIWDLHNRLSEACPRDGHCFAPACLVAAVQ